MRLLRDWWPALLVAATIFTLSSFPLRAPPGAPDWSDVVAHIGIYGLLAAVILRGALRQGWPRPAAIAVVAAVAYGVTDELHQSFVPGRSPDPRDVAADAVGALLAVVAVTLLVRQRRVAAAAVDEPRPE